MSLKRPNMTFTITIPFKSYLILERIATENGLKSKSQAVTLAISKAGAWDTQTEAETYQRLKDDVKKQAEEELKALQQREREEELRKKELKK